MLTFIAEYPNDANIRDGMMLRIMEIDHKYAQFNRVYLDISFFRARKNKGVPTIVSDKVAVYHLNFFLDFFAIYKHLNNANYIYIQAIYNYVKVLIFVNFFLRKTEIALDLHGAIPEEIKYQNSKMVSVFYQWVENAAFKRCQHFIHVTFAMKKHFLEKYPLKIRLINSQDYVLGIFTSYNSTLDSKRLELIKSELNWKEEDVWFLYSGGIQDWQNVPLVIKTMKSLQNSNYRFLILTGQPQIVLNWMEEEQIDDKKIVVKSVSPNQLKEYYSISNYGFVLRNADVVNKVSNPTKLSEYLAYSIVPIVLDPNIGDYLDMGFEYIKLEDLKNSFNKNSSPHNKKVYEDYINKMSKVSLPFS